MNSTSRSFARALKWCFSLHRKLWFSHKQQNGLMRQMRPFRPWRLLLICFLLARYSVLSSSAAHHAPLNPRICLLLGCLSRKNVYSTLAHHGVSLTIEKQKKIIMWIFICRKSGKWSVSLGHFIISILNLLSKFFRRASTLFFCTDSWSDMRDVTLKSAFNGVQGSLFLRSK